MWDFADKLEQSGGIIVAYMQVSQLQRASEDMSRNLKDLVLCVMCRAVNVFELSKCSVVFGRSAEFRFVLLCDAGTGDGVWH